VRRSKAESKVIVLLSDGINNAGEIDPISAAAVCQGLGIKVYTVGVGGAQLMVPVPFPTPPNPLTGRSEIRRMLMSLPVDEKLLRTIAQRTGGQYFLATDSESLQRIFREIDRLEKTPLQVRRYVRYQEAFPPLVWAGLGLLVLPFAAALLRITAEP
jgi:Ca-activated chloride channel family protein